MTLGHGGRFFAQLGFLLRQRLTIREALDLVAREVVAPGWTEAVRRAADRIDRGEALGTALGELPPPFPRELLPFIEEMENQGLLLDEADALAAWPDAGTREPDALLARVFAHASILARRGSTINDALARATRPEDPDSLRSAIRDVSHGVILGRSLADVMGDHPRVFSPAVRRVMLQMERNLDPASTFRALALALASGWFAAPPGAPPA